MPKPLFIALLGGTVYVGFAVGFNLGESSAVEKIIDYTCEKITDRTAYIICVRLRLRLRCGKVTMILRNDLKERIK